MGRKRGGLAGIWDRNKKIIKPVAQVGAGIIGGLLGGPAGAAAAGAATGAAFGFDREGKSGIGYDAGKGLGEGVKGAALGSLGGIGAGMVGGGSGAAAGGAGAAAGGGASTAGGKMANIDWGNLANLGINAYGAISGASAAKKAANQQDAYVNKQIALAERQYGDRAPYRSMSLAMLQDPNLYLDPESNYMAMASRYQPQLDAALKKAADGPDRLALARQALSDYDTNEANVLSDQYRGLGQKAAVLGRIGSGMVTDDLSKALADATVRRKTLSNDLIREATKASVDDRYRALDAYRNATGDDLGLQQQNFTNNRAALNDARGAQGEKFARATSLAGLGYAGDPSAAYRTAADMYGNRVNVNAAAAGDAAGNLGYALASRYRPLPPSSGTTSPN